MMNMRLKCFKIFFFSLMFINCACAQLCLGSLGDPIVNTNFGNGSNPGPPLLAATTNYQYVSTDCPNDGFYTVRNSSSSCFGNTWHSFLSDHTGDPGGYFMLVNASVQPSSFYLDTVRGLCGNTTYEFAAWIMNVILPSACGGNSIQPDLTFSIEKTDGTILQTYNTGSIPPLSSPTWKQSGFFFTTPAAVSDIVLRIFNNSQGGCGNDLALDDITFRPCGPLLDPAITGVISDTATLCEGTARSYTFTCSVSGGFINPVLQWQDRINNGSWTDIPGANALSLSRIFPANTPAGQYEFRLAVAEFGNMGFIPCRIASKPLGVIINALPVTGAKNNGPVCAKSNITLTATGGSQYQWTGPNGYTGSGTSIQLTNVQVNQAGKYYVTVTNIAGCVNTDSTTIIVDPTPIATIRFSDASICAGDSIQLIAGGGLAYNWIPATGLSSSIVFNPWAAPAISTNYLVVVSNSFSCRDTARSNINIIIPAVVDAGPDKIIMKGKKTSLSGMVSGQGISYSWSPAVFIDDPLYLKAIINPPADMKYVLTAFSDIGCKSISDTMYVKVYNDIYIPNAFSPNGDKINETWNIPALSAYPNFELFIYNRYGQMIFRTKTSPVAWDGLYRGKPCANGVYTYLIKTGDAREPISGTLMLIR